MENEFELTNEHLILLKSMYVGWQDCETGAPEIDPKRPYGNSSVALDVAELLGWNIDEDEGLTEYQEDKAMELHRGTKTALQICLSTQKFRAGIYHRVNSRREWELKL